MRFFLIALILFSALAIPGPAVPPVYVDSSLPSLEMNLIGRWRVKFTLGAGSEKNLIFDSQPNGAGYFHLLDTGPDDKPVPGPLPAAWSQLSNERVSFSGEAELPIGTCCREIGTLIFKGKFSTNNSVSGRMIFVTSVEEEESAYKFRSMVGTFQATRLQPKSE